MKSLDRVRSTYSAGVRASETKEGRKHKTKPASARLARARQTPPSQPVRKRPEAPASREEEAVEYKPDLSKELKDAREELERTRDELFELKKAQNDFKCHAWLEGASGRSTVLASAELKASEVGESTSAPAGANEDLQKQLVEKDRLISELRANLGAIRLKKEDSLRAQVEAGIAKGLRDAEGKQAAKVSRHVHEMEKKSKSTVDRLVQSLKSFDGGKVAESLETTMARMEEDLVSRIEDKCDKMDALSSRQGGLARSLSEKVTGMSENISRLEQKCMNLREANAVAESVLREERGGKAKLALKLAAKDELLRVQRTQVDEHRGRAKQIESELLAVKSQASIRASEFVESSKSLHQRLLDAEEALRQKSERIRGLEGAQTEAMARASAESDEKMARPAGSRGSESKSDRGRGSPISDSRGERRFSVQDRIFAAGSSQGACQGLELHERSSSGDRKAERQGAGNGK